LSSTCPVFCCLPVRYSHNPAGFVFDILGNSSVRYEQFDGTTSLPFRSDGKYHLGGRVVITPPDVLKKIVNNVVPIFRAKGKKPCVIIPPLPRYLFLRCCSEENHCTNAKEAGYVEQLMSGFLKLRNDLIKQLVQSGLTDFKVLDSCCITECKQTADIPERIKSLRETTWQDGAHFNSEGYKHLAERATCCLKGIMTSPKIKKTGQEHTFGEASEVRMALLCQGCQGVLGEMGGGQPLAGASVVMREVACSVGTVSYHCGGWSEEVNSCILISYMVYL
jgi:hypothetical protein